ncbi:BQ2448_4623 [Microbotryum intermedium]|uniref:BQ2448_4623 protein n=1 Tax=Microbotryum intermedium TaxID=269621 RepID=A0A238FGK0_9BASI|nr:BQ2448_4623 [Microbotryum intermedium]
MRLSSYLRSTSSLIHLKTKSNSHSKPPPATAAAAVATTTAARPSLAARHQPWPIMSNNPGAAWNAVLEQYARFKNPHRELPQGVHLLSDSKCVTIFDGYEKAKYHFLVMRTYCITRNHFTESTLITVDDTRVARDPFHLDSSSNSASNNSTSTASSSVPSSHLTSLKALRKSPHCLPVLRALQEQAQQVQEMIEEEMIKKEGWKWPVQIGFHARESMKHVHLHVISSDLISPKLKNKKHYNSFHPSLGFFLHLNDVIEQVEASQENTRSSSFYENLFKLPLRSHYTGQEYPTIPKLKVHLEEEWERRGREGKRKQKQLDQDGTKATTTTTTRKKRTEEEDRDAHEAKTKKVKLDPEDGGGSSGDETI